MKSSTLIVWLLVAACIAIDLALIGELQIRRNEWPEAGGLCGLGLVFAQIALISLWAVCGRSSIVVRGISTLLGIWAVSYLASYSSDGGPGAVGVWFGVLLLYGGVSLVPFMIARFANHDLSCREANDSPPAYSRLSSNQFTIWGLLSLMTAVGIALATLRFADFPMRQRLEIAAFFTLLAATACSLLLLSLFVSRISIAVTAAIIVCPIAGSLLSFTRLAPGEGTLELIVMTCTLGAAILSAAIVLRAAGYRLVRHAVRSETKD